MMSIFYFLIILVTEYIISILQHFLFVFLQGHHEHLFSFTDARLLSVDDPQRVADYPFERSVGTQHSKFCMICDVNISKWVTENNERVPEEPFFFCDVCYRGYNYDENGEKIGDFRAYPYVDVNAL